MHHSFRKRSCGQAEKINLTDLQRFGPKNPYPRTEEKNLLIEEIKQKIEELILHPPPVRKPVMSTSAPPTPKESPVKAPKQKPAPVAEVLSGDRYLDASEVQGMIVEPSSSSSSSEDIPEPCPRKEEPGLNEKFQMVRENLQLPDHKLDTNLVKSAFQRDFLSTARDIAKVIISEVFLPIPQKTIKPTTHIGGVLGGEKYIVRDILFKHALGTGIAHQKGVREMSHEQAMKVAAHELKTLNFLMEVPVTGINYPLQCVIDYLGFRVVAVLLLPLAPANSLKVGTSDAGNTIFGGADDPELKQKMDEIGDKLNLGCHLVGSHEFKLPGDCEGHRGKDGKMYIIDLSRIFPPVPPRPRHKGKGQLFELFRPEFVTQQMYPEPLCNDLFSNFVSPGEENDMYVTRAKLAEETLLKEIIPGFVPKFNELIQHLIIIGRKSWGISHLSIPVLLHKEGINLRYMGYLYQADGVSDEAKVFLLIEMAARTIKRRVRDEIRDQMEKRTQPQESPYLKIFFGHFSHLIQPPANEDITRIYGQAIRDYYDLTSVSPQDEGFFDEKILKYSLKDAWGRTLLIDQVLKGVGIRLAEGVGAKLKADPKSYVMDASCFSGFKHNIKHMSIVSYSSGHLIKKWTNEPAKHFERADAAFTLSKFTLRQLAGAYLSQWLPRDGRPPLGLDGKVSPERQKQAVSQKFYINYLYRLAITHDSKDTNTLYQYAQFLKLIGHPDCEIWCLKACLADPTHYVAFKQYEEILEKTFGLGEERKAFTTNVMTRQARIINK